MKQNLLKSSESNNINCDSFQPELSTSTFQVEVSRQAVKLELELYKDILFLKTLLTDNIKGSGMIYLMNFGHQELIEIQNLR